MCLATLSIFSQYNPSDCFASGEDYSVSSDFPNNNSVLDFSFNKKYLGCDDVSSTFYGGFSFRTQYSVSNLIGEKDLFRLRIGTYTLMLFRLNNQKIEVLRDVIYRPCNSWSNGVCQTFGATVKGVSTLSTWDNEILNSTTGWIWIKVVDNMMKIRISEEKMGPYKTEYNYEGLHLSGVDQELADNSDSNVNISIPANSSSGINLSNITFSAGLFFDDTPVNIDDNSKSPETNFPVTGSGTLLRGTTNNELIKKSEVIKVVVEENFASKLLLYPNPTKDGAFTLNFALKADAPVRFEIVNALGQIVFSKQKQLVSKGNNSFQFGKEDVNLNSGLYIVNIFTNEFSKSLKLIVE